MAKDNLDRKDLLNEITKNLKSTMILKYDLKEVEEDIKDEYASIHQLKNKKGETDTKQVKFGEMKTALQLHFKSKDKDDLLEKYERQEEYRKNMKIGNDAFPVDKGKKYVELLNTRKDFTSELTEIKKTCAANEVPEIEIQAMCEIAKLIVAKEEAVIVEEIARKEGKTLKKKKSVEIEEKIQELLKEFNIKL